MPRWLILTGTHILVMSIGFAGGIYLLPILTAPPAPTEAALQNSASKAVYVGRFARDLKGSDLLHWGDGEPLLRPLILVVLAAPTQEKAELTEHRANRRHLEEYPA